MANAYVSEYAYLGGTATGRAPMAQEPALAEQKVAFTGTAAASAAFNAATRYIRIHVDAAASFVVGANPTATTSSKRIAADGIEYFAVNPGDKISFITN